MHAPKHQSIKSTLSLTLSLIAIIPFLSLGCLWIFTVYQNKTNEINGTYQRLLDQEKQKLKKQVYNIHHFIKQYDQSLEHNLYTTIEKRNNEAYAIMEGIYNKYKETMPTKKIKKLIKETLRPIRYHNGKGYYFLVDLKHTEVLYPIHPEYEGANLIDLKDSHGTFVIRKEVQLAKDKGGGFVTDYWPKPGTNQDKAYPKISHVKLFKPLGWIVGTGLYLDDFKSFVQDQILTELTRFDFFNKEKNFFLDTSNGVPLIFNGKRVYHQKSLMELQDENQIWVYRRYKKAAFTTSGDFFEYHWKKSLKDKTGIPKLSFAYHYDKWNWMFGAGSYLDDLHKLVKEQENALYKKLYTLIYQLIFLLLILLAVILFIVRRILHSFVIQLTKFTVIFHKAVETNELLNLHQFKFLEFKALASSTNINILKFKRSQQEAEKVKLIQERNARFISLGEMAGGIAHEINNPLLVIKGYLALLKKEIPESKHDEVQKIDLAVNRISAIIQGFKELTSMSSNQLHKKRIVLGDFLEQIKPMVDFNLVKYNVEFKAQTVDGPILTDPTILGQILTNLIHNSVYAIKNKQDRWIQLHSKRLNDTHLQIKVVDSGLRHEIPNPETIFEPLITNKPPGDGTGLGLSLSKNMARRLGGDLILDPNESNTTFILTIDISEQETKL